MAEAYGGEIVETNDGSPPSGVGKLGPGETVKSTMSQRPPLPPSFHISNSPKFHVANIQNLLTKRKSGEKGMFMKEIEKIKFLNDMCNEEKPYFLAFAETWLNDSMKEVKYEIEGYSYVASHRKDREGGGVIIYINNDATFKPLISISDDMCSVVAIYFDELNLIVFMVYRPPPQIIRVYTMGTSWKGLSMR